jgi:hypothetical protein
MELTFEDGTKQRVKLPADVWRANELKFTYGFFTDKTVAQVVIDPDEAYTDVERANNTWRKPGTPVS